MRSKARLAAEGEKITKYFCSLEKRNFISKQIKKKKKKKKKIADKNGSVLEEPNVIMNKVQCFYERLYKSRNVEDCEINELISEIPELSEQHATSII